MKTFTTRLLGSVIVSLSFAVAFYYVESFNAKNQAAVKSVSSQRSISSVGIQGNQCFGFYLGKQGYPRTLSKAGIQIFENKRAKSKMAYEFIPPAHPNGQVLVFIHGLGQDLFSMQAIIERAVKDGFGVLRVDQHGHGETLNQDLLKNRFRFPVHLDARDLLPRSMDYRDNVNDIVALVKSLKIQGELGIVGHSYGGGTGGRVAARLVAELPKGQVKLFAGEAMYAKRIDKYISDSMISGQMAINTTIDFLQSLSLSKEVTAPVFNQMFSFAQNYADHVMTILNMSTLFLRTDMIHDMMTDPSTDKFMYENFKSHFLAELGRSESDLTAEETKLLEIKVYAAILVTKGARELDYLNPMVPIGEMPRIVLIMGGREDKLVTPDQMRRVSERLTDEKINHELKFYEGPLANHFFPQTMPDAVYEDILEAMTRPD